MTLRQNEVVVNDQKPIGTTLTCTECGAEAPPDALGWRALLGYDPREDESSEAFMFCPECAEREFGV